MSTEVNIDELIEMSMKTNKPYGDKYGVTFDYNSADEKLEVMGDYQRLLQVMTNFLSNAAKFSPSGSTVEISVVQTEKSTIRISVTDFGPGVSDEFKSKIFDRFAQADSSNTRQVGGTGLGLAISKAIIDKHAGTIGFTNNSPCGATFYFEIPARQADLRQVI
jgi:signal transduction histidine kinase